MNYILIKLLFKKTNKRKCITSYSDKRGGGMIKKGQKKKQKK